jgi:hypothetical protein
MEGIKVTTRPASGKWSCRSCSHQNWLYRGKNGASCGGYDMVTFERYIGRTYRCQ